MQGEVKPIGESKFHEFPAQRNEIKMGNGKWVVGSG